MHYRARAKAQRREARRDPHRPFEGTSINVTARIVGVSKVSVRRLLADVGTICADFHYLTVRNLETKRVEADQVWGYVGAHDAVIAKRAIGFGSVWTWTARDADSKVIISYKLGDRTSATAKPFVLNPAERVTGGVTLTATVRISAKSISPSGTNRLRAAHQALRQSA